jgi:hypothetical protein
MRTYTGSQSVEPGLYFNVKRFSVKSIESRGPLPGTRNDEYRRAPMLVMLLIAPLLGLAYVIFLPLIGFAMVTWLLGDKAAQLATGAAAKAVRVLRPGWAPSLAFLSRSKPAEPDKNVEQTPDAWTEEVEKKLSEADRRG